MCPKWGEGGAADALVNLYLRPNMPEQSPDGALHFLRNCLQRPERRGSHCPSAWEPILAQECGLGGGFYLEDEEISLAFLWVRVSWCRYTVANKPHWTPSQLWNAGRHVSSSQRRTLRSTPVTQDVESGTEQREKWACHQHHEDLSQSYDVPRTQCPAKLFQIMAFPLPSDSSNEARPRQLWGDLSSPLRELSLEPGCGLLAYGLGQGVSPPQGLVSHLSWRKRWHMFGARGKDSLRLQVPSTVTEQPAALSTDTSWGRQWHREGCFGDKWDSSFLF